MVLTKLILSAATEDGCSNGLQAWQTSDRRQLLNGAAEAEEEAAGADCARATAHDPAK